EMAQAMKSIGVILAAGKGERFGGTQPKQFVKLAGKLVIEHTMEVFEKSSHIHEIIIVAQQDYVQFIWELAENNRWLKLQKVLVRGADRFDSTQSAIASMAQYDDSAKVLFHDAVRALVSEDIL